MAKARTRDSMQALDKLTHVVDGERRIISDPPLIQPVEELAGGMERDQIMDWLRAAVRSYRQHACRATAVTCSRTSGWSTSPARSSASAASARERGSC